MKLLSSIQSKSISGGIASMSGGFSMGPGGMTFQNGFFIKVTNTSTNILGNFAAYSNKVVNLHTNEVLFDGTQKSFCINGASFAVSPIEGGHVYKYNGNC